MDEAVLTVGRIIERCGGVAEIVRSGGGAIGRWAPYKWAKTGIPEQHWHMIRALCGATAEELHAANEIARARQGDSSLASPAAACGPGETEDKRPGAPMGARGRDRDLGESAVSPAAAGASDGLEKAGA